MSDANWNAIVETLLANVRSDFEADQFGPIPAGLDPVEDELRKAIRATEDRLRKAIDAQQGVITRLTLLVMRSWNDQLQCRRERDWLQHEFDASRHLREIADEAERVAHDWTSQTSIKMLTPGCCTGNACINERGRIFLDNLAEAVEKGEGEAEPEPEEDE